MGFKDRRFYGRRYRNTDNIEEVFGSHEPPPIGGWQADVPIERYLEF
jgi:hypothetical protein